MTVSRVLRDNPNVSQRVRDHVWAIAEEQGYRPDPDIGRLMEHLRKRRTSRLQGCICTLVSPNWKPPNDPYTPAILAGARSVAAELGFAWDEISVDDVMNRPNRTLQVLRSRGIQGIVLPPMPAATVRLPPSEHWTEFSVVSMTYAVIEPQFNLIVPDHFRNVQIVCRALAARGCRRIGLDIRKRLDQRAQYHFSGGYAAFHSEIGSNPIPLTRYSNVDGPDGLRAWYDHERPDGIITTSSSRARAIAKILGLAIPGPVALATIAIHDPSVFTCGGIDQLPRAVGARAVERLARMILRGETGVPEHPSVTMIEGEWHDEADTISKAQSLSLQGSV